MDMKTAVVNAAVNPKEGNAPINPTAAPDAAATPTSEPTFTESQLREIMATLTAQALGSQGTAPAPAGAPTAAEPRQATKPEACAAHKLLTLLERTTSKVIVGTRDHVVVPGNLYVVDKATPEVLAVVAAGSIIAASGAKKVSDYFARLAESLAAKSAAFTRR
jgi:hypothetical protein